jgi:predicted RNA-binding Zn-ribbon protein involved in translation (DUF1610 family)
MILPSPVRLDAEKIKQNADFLSIVSRYTRLRKAGRQYVGLCPFHSERHPSFYVEPVRKLWNCFGCGLGGDVLSFVMRVEGCNFVSALRFLVSGHPNVINTPHVSSRVPRTVRPRLESFAEAATRIAVSLPSPGFIPSCPRCSTSMIFRSYRDNRFGGAYQCSSCAAFFGPRELRKKLFTDRGALCQWCCTSGTVLQMHHVLKKADPFDPAWIVLLCRACRENVRKLLAIQRRFLRAAKPPEGSNEVRPRPLNSQSRGASLGPSRAFTCTHRIALNSTARGGSALM